MKEILYKSTRGTGETLKASEAILKGLADDGGLFVPTEIPKLEATIDAVSYTHLDVYKRQQIHCQDGSVDTIYGSEGARYSDSRSVSYIAKQIKLDSNYYNSLSTTNKNIIYRFANN